MNNNSVVRQISLVFFFVLATLASGCGSSSHSVPTSYNLQFRAHPQINESAPLKVRVLLLKSDATFMSADFWSLQNNADSALGGNLLNSDEFFLMPGQLSKTLTGNSSPEARYIGVMRISLPLPVQGESHFYEFWKSSEDALEANIFLDVNGIRVISK